MLNLSIGLVLAKALSQYKLCAKIQCVSHNCYKGVAIAEQQ